jgi:hypothetical protein
MKNFYQDQDKRVYSRFKVNFPFEVKGDDFELTTQMKDISCSGLFCQADKYIAPKTKLRVILNIPFCVDQKIEKKIFACWGEVVRIYPDYEREGVDYQLGIAFDGLSSEEKNLILRFIRQRNIKEARELRSMFKELEKTIGKLKALEESHPTAEHFCKVITEAINELEDVAKTLDHEINEIQKAT